MERSISGKIPRRTKHAAEKYQIKQVLRHRLLDEKTAWVEETGSYMSLGYKRQVAMYLVGRRDSHVSFGYKR
jgi:hypothetical protein